MTNGSNWAGRHAHDRSRDVRHQSCRNAGCRYRAARTPERRGAKAAEAARQKQTDDQQAALFADLRDILMPCADQVARVRSLQAQDRAPWNLTLRYAENAA